MPDMHKGPTATTPYLTKSRDLATRSTKAYCSFDGCDAMRMGKHGLCMGHRHQQRQGRPLKPIIPKGTPLLERFRMRTAPIKPDANGCMRWEGDHCPAGYGRMWSGEHGRALSSHRVSYEYYHGPVPEGLELHHTCAVRNCFAPDHLQLVTRAANMAEMRARRSYENRIKFLERRVALLELALADVMSAP